MRIVIQRVKEAYVRVGERMVGTIRHGMLILVGVGQEDTLDDVGYLISKVSELRIFDDEKGKMNRSIREVGGEFLVVSQFTLLGDCVKGRRPSFDGAADPQKAEELYNEFIKKLREQNFKVETGEFRAMMEVGLVNDGPVTFVLESK